MTNSNTAAADYNELYAQYNWFSTVYPPVVQSSVDEFFEPNFEFILLGISKNINTLMDKDAYFVTKIRVDKQHDVFFRTSEKAVGIILDKILGKPNSRFNLNKLTDLEAKIITAFNDYLFNSTSQFLSPPPPTLKRTNFDVIHLTFLLKDKDTNAVSKFIITLPEVLVKPDIVVSTSDKFSYGDFSTSIIEASVKIGSTRCRLIDVKGIETDDIVVLDDSDTNHMMLKFKDYEKEINLNPNMGLVLPSDNDEGENIMADNTNLWDSIEVEMSAQFDTVKVSLGELKKIEDGLVVDLTSIYDNKVTLSVEDKPIARGELVIVNDRYGVKISEVLTKSPSVDNSMPAADNNSDAFNMPQGDENAAPAAMNEQPVQTAQTPADEEEEFDYSDFELEDEDI